MSSFKEIVTKAVIGKAKKTNSNSFTLTPEEMPNTVLGCWVINHSFNGVKGSNGSVTINGNFDVNVWYSYDSDKKTLIINDKEKEILHHASREDLMLMIKLINPKFYMPVKGEYRYMVNNANLASNLGIPDENILLKQNGDVVTFEDGKFVDNFARIKVDDVLIDGTSNDDIGDLVIKDREMLSENGIVLISATVDKKDKVLLVGPEVTTRGFIYVKDSADMIKEIKVICEAIINRNITPKYIDFNQIKVEIREELSRYLYDLTECKPMIIAVVQEV